MEIGNIHVGAAYQPRATVRTHIALNCKAISESPDQYFCVQMYNFLTESIEINKIVNLLIYDLRTIVKIDCR